MTTPASTGVDRTHARYCWFVHSVSGRIEGMSAVAFLTDDVDGVVVVPVVEVDGVLVDLGGRAIELVRVVEVVGLPELERAS